MNNDSEFPVQLEKDENSGDRFLVYGDESGIRLDIHYKSDTLWMTQAQISQLFGRERTVITKHILNIFEDGELEEGTCVQKLHRSIGRPSVLYNLDVVISVGYRVSSRQATMFRKWATATLVQFATKGFVVDSRRLKNPDEIDRVRELREIVKDIRSDEANIYRELQKICALCQDYEGGTQQAISFFKQMQAKLVYAVVSGTPAEVVRGRADHKMPNMGLQTWPHKNLRKADVTVSKNYLAERELRELNSLTAILLDVFDLQLEAGRLLLMVDAEKLLERQLNGLDRVILRDGGSVTKKAADIFAHQQYEAWKEKEKQLRHAKADRAIQKIAKEVKKLPKA